MILAGGGKQKGFAMTSSPDIIQNSRQLRKNMTKEERHLWYDFLRLHPVRFRRQHPVGNYIVDFFCSEAKLVIELDGSQHFDPEGLAYDHKRTEYIQAQGFLVLRYSNTDINQNFRGVCEHIDRIVSLRR